MQHIGVRHEQVPKGALRTVVRQRQKSHDKDPVTHFLAHPATRDDSGLPMPRVVGKASVRDESMAQLAILREPFPAEWEAVLQRDVVFFRVLQPEAQQRFRRQLQVFL